MDLTRLLRLEVLAIFGPASFELRKARTGEPVLGVTLPGGAAADLYIDPRTGEIDYVSTTNLGVRLALTQRWPHLWNTEVSWLP